MSAVDRENARSVWHARLSPPLSVQGARILLVADNRAHVSLYQVIMEAGELC